MGRRTSYEPGTFCWADLATTDAQAAKAFYGRLFGWDAVDMPAGDDATYTMLRRDGANVAALYQQGDDQREQGMAPMWLSYVSVDAVDALAERVPALAGTVLRRPFDVLQAGRMAVVADPQGAVLLLWQPRGHHGADVVNEPGALSWNDLLTTDVDGAAAFYGELLGWEIEQVPGAPYWTIRNGGRSNGGIMPMPEEQRAAGMPTTWNAYFAAEDLDDALATAQEVGGALLLGPMAVPAGRFAVLRDPQGAVFSLLTGDLDP